MNTRAPVLLATLALSAAGLAACSSVGPASDPPTATLPPPPGGQVMCAQDTQQCPDGRWVGRRPPSCQFDCSSPARR